MRTIPVLVLLAILFLASCEKDNPDPYKERLYPLVTNIYNNNILIAHYEYNNHDQLIKREYTDPSDNNVSDMLFHYKNNLLSKIENVDYNLQTTYVDSFYYNSDHKIVQIKTYENERLLYTSQLNYSSEGLVESVEIGNSQKNFYEYDVKGNVVKATNYYKNLEGKEVYVKSEFTFDSMKKPNFNLDYLTGIDLLPWRGNSSNWEQSLSKNNIINEPSHNIEYIIEYNNANYPISITTKQGETYKPLTIKIEYQ